MRILSLTFAVVGLFVCAGLTAYRAFDRWLSDPATLAQRQLQLDEARRSAEWWQHFRDVLTPLLIVAAAVVILVAVVAAVAVVAIALLRFYDGRVKTARTWSPSKAGLWPVSADALDQVAAVAMTGYHAAQLEAARQPRLPDNLRAYHHAPRYTEGRSTPQADQLAAPDPARQIVATPTFADLLREGRLAPGQNVLPLGFRTEDGGAVGGSWSNLYSTCVAGLQGSGKSTTLRYLAGASVIAGARLVVIDPHAHHADDGLASTLAPLSPAMLCPPAVEEAEIRQALQLVDRELVRRKNGGMIDQPLLICVDEWSALQRSRVADQLAEVLEGVCQEGRKFQVYSLLSGQVWTVQRSGGSALRDALASAYIHRSRPAQARAAWPGVEGRDVLNLAPGEAMLFRTSSEPVRVRIPNTTRADLERVAGLLPAPSSSSKSDSASWSAPTKRQDAPAPAVQQVADEEAEPTVNPRATWRVLNSQNSVGAAVPVRTSTPTADSTPAATPEAVGAVPVRTSTPDELDPTEVKVVELFNAGASKNSICALVFGSKTPKTLREVNRILTAAGLVADQKDGASC